MSLSLNFKKGLLTMSAYKAKQHIIEGLQQLMLNLARRSSYALNFSLI